MNRTKSNKSLKLACLVSLVIFLVLPVTQPLTHASSLPFQTGQLATANQLTIAGSSILAPVAQEEAAQFPNYWSNLVAANPGWGTALALDIDQINIGTLGSGNAVSALAAGTADVGEMSRPPSSIEWQTSNMGVVLPTLWDSKIIVGALMLLQQ